MEGKILASPVISNTMSFLPILPGFGGQSHKVEHKGKMIKEVTTLWRPAGGPP